MKHAVFTFGRFNPPTEAGHGKLIDAVKSHAESVGGDHFIFPSHSQDKKKNPLSHEDKVSAINSLFPDTNVVSDTHVRTAIDALKHLEKKGYTHATMVVGSDRVGEFNNLLNKYNGKEYNFKNITVKSAGNRDPDAEGAEGMSASKLRGLVSAGKRAEFISHYSNKKVGADIHDKVKAAMSEATNSPMGIFLFGGPGCGKDYLLKNIFSRFDLVEVQADQIILGTASILFENNQNIVINCSAESKEKIVLIKSMMENYDFDHVFVRVSNQVSRARNMQRKSALSEAVRIRKMLEAEKICKDIPDVFVFNNSLNLNEASTNELSMFASQIESLLERLVNSGLVMQEKTNLKTFAQFKEQALEWGTKHTVDVYKAMTPGENNEFTNQTIQKTVSQEAPCACGCAGDCSCGGDCSCSQASSSGRKSFSAFREEATKKTSNAQIQVNTRPVLKTKKETKGQIVPARQQDSTKDAMYSYGGLNPQSMYEAIKYHNDNNISLVENAYRPGSDMFFALINEAKMQYASGNYTPKDAYEQEILESNIGEKANYNGKEVILDFPFEELTEEEGSDPTKGKGIGKPFRKGGGGAVYVKTGDGVKLVNFSQSGMTKKYNDPGRLKSFMARHNCLGNKDKTSAAYWACRWPRYFSSGGQQWW